MFSYDEGLYTYYDQHGNFTASIFVSTGICDVKIYSKALPPEEIYLSYRTVTE